MLEILRRRTSAVLLVTALTAACGGSSSSTTPPPPTGVDLLGGAGKFDTEANQAMWRVQKPDGATANDDLWAACDTGSKCAKIALSAYGANEYSSQLGYFDTAAATPAPKRVTMDPTKGYTIKLWAKAVNAADTADTKHTVSVWVQSPAYDGTTYAKASFDVTATGKLYTSDVITFAAAGPVDGEVVINLGPASANDGTTFYFDDFEILEGAPPPPPAGTDLLAGNGSFDTDDQIAHWYFQVQGGATATIEYVAADGFTGKVAKITGNTGTTNYYTQLGWADPANPGKFATIKITADKKYQIRAKVKADGLADGATVNVPAWLQEGNASATVQQAWSGGPVDILFSSTVATRVLAAFQGQDAVPELKLNFGATTGLTFYVDDIQLVEVKE